MTPRKRLAYRALTGALRLRRSQGVGPRAAFCPPDLAEGLGIELRFLDIGSFDGGYFRQPEPMIIVSSLRPAGRRAFTIGHEIGHHVFGHGTTLDRLLDHGAVGGNGSDQSSGHELLADMFSGFLLMAPSAVKHAFAVRGARPETATPYEVFLIASWFGVGYATLIWHLASGLRLLSGPRARELLRFQPKHLKREIAGGPVGGDLVVVDKNWSDRPIDLQVGDEVLLPPGVKIEGESVSVLRDDGNNVLIAGRTPGISRVHDPDSGWAAFGRVSRKGYVGRSVFRHLEEVTLE